MKAIIERKDGAVWELELPEDGSVPNFLKEDCRVRVENHDISGTLEVLGVKAAPKRRKAAVKK